MSLQIAVLYSSFYRHNRTTLLKYLFSFKRYAEGAKFHYINVHTTVPFVATLFKYDVVILHYTFLGEFRFVRDAIKWNKKIKSLSKIKGYKVAMPQDEYDCTDFLIKLIKESGVKFLYTCFSNTKDIEKAYPKNEIGDIPVKSIFTGYVDEDDVNMLKSKIKPYADRQIVIGYRARKLPAYLGAHAQIKSQLTHVFNGLLQKSTLNTDIVNTDEVTAASTESAVKLGNSWYDFLLDCRSTLGCEGGASLIDPHGLIKQKVKQYSQTHPKASFSEIEANCFPGEDYNIACFALSPRHFEAAMCKTLQILVEGEYGGIFKPWVHYIPVKKDYSNAHEVIAFLDNESQCQKIVDKAYEDIVLSSKYTYRKFVNDIIADVCSNITPNKRPSFLFKTVSIFLNIRNSFLWIIHSIRVRIISLRNF